MENPDDTSCATADSCEPLSIQKLVRTRKAGAKNLSKRRSTVACRNCRLRKVRCDLTYSRGFCTNCRLDNVKCELAEGKRSWRTNNVGQRAITHVDFSCWSDEGQVKCLQTWEDGTRDLANQMNTIIDHEASVEDEHETVHDCLCANSFDTPSKTSQVLDVPTACQCGKSDSSQSPHIECDSHLQLPQYVQRSRRMLAPEETQYLCRSGAFVLPSIELRNELLRVYTQYVYPYLPVIDLNMFLESIDRIDVGETISLSLLQAVYFTASAFVSMELLAHEGFRTRDEARRTFFGRVRVLYSFSFETDRLSLIQTLLHLTHWTEELNTIKDAGGWLATAITMARSVGLHSHIRYASFSSNQKRLAKRIWWTCFTRDQVLALLLNRPPLIQVEDFTTPSLELRDFKLPTSAANSELTVDFSLNVSDVPSMETVAKLYISLARLCLCLAGTLRNRQPMSKTSRTSYYSLRGDTPREDADRFCKILQADQELEMWYSGLPNQVKYVSEEAQDLNRSENDPVIKLHIAFLYSIYLASKSILHRDATPASTNQSIIPNDLRKWSRQNAVEAISNITSTFQDLLKSELIRYLPSISVHILLEAVSTSLLTTIPMDPSSTQDSIRVLHNCSQGLESLGDVYDSAKTARKFVAAAKRRLEASLRRMDSEHNKIPNDLPEKRSRIETLPLKVLILPSKFQNTTSPIGIPIPHSPDIQEASPSSMGSTIETDFCSRTNITSLQTPISLWTPRDGNSEEELVHDQDVAKHWDDELEDLVYFDMFTPGEFRSISPVFGILEDDGC